MKYFQIKHKIPKIIGLLVVAILIVACSSSSNSESSVLQATSTALIENGQATQATETSESSGPITLNLWLPPIFSNFSGDLASALLQQRLDLFHELNPNVQIEVRLKAEGVSGGLIDSLSIASDAAPLALPDIVLMNEHQLELAIQDDLVTALNDQLSFDLDSDWYAFGLEMVSSGSEILALPFVGDAMIMMHRFSAIEIMPKTWSDTLAEPLVVGFPAGDPDALFTLLQYAGLLLNDGQPIDFASIDSDLMLRLLNYYSEGQSSGIFPFWLSQYEDDEQIWQAFLDGRMPILTTWSNRYFLSTDDNQGAAAVPTVIRETISFAKAWAWAITSPNNERQSLAIKLAEFLSEAEFLAQWSSAAGYLPARESALAAWAPNAKQVLGLQIAASAHLVPRQEFQNRLGPAISKAVIALIKQEISAQEANNQISAELLIE